MIPRNIKAILAKQHYGMVGNHSAVQICRWTKKSLLDEGFCYKQQFYGINSHRCCQMTPAVSWCPNKCVFCWRAIEHTLGTDMKNVDIDEPKGIIEGCIKAQQKQLSGFGGNEKVNAKKLKEAMEPMHFAISLSGEPTLYPKISELIKELRRQGKTSFLVTNGLLPKVLEKMEMPTQLYISLDAPNEKLFKKIDKPQIRNAWNKFNKTIELLPKLKTRTTLRITAIKGLNMCNEEQYAALIKQSEPMFVEVKSYMWVGFSRKRLKMENMPLHNEVVEFAQNIAKHCSYRIIDEKKESRVVLLMREDSKERVMRF